MAIGLEVVANNIAGVLQNLAPIVSIILIVLAPIFFVVGGQFLLCGETPDEKKKWQARGRILRLVGVLMGIGGIIIMMMTGVAYIIQSTTAAMLQPV